MNISEEINEFIAENGGNERDALNVALARLEKITQENISLKDRLRESVEECNFLKMAQHHETKSRTPIYIEKNYE